MSAERDYDRTFAQYEEDRAGSRVYTFETDLGGDVDWRSTGRNERSFFRVVGGRMQLVLFQEDAPAGDRAELEAFLRSMPLLTGEGRGVIEVWIGRDDVGWFLRDYAFETNGPIVGDLPELTRENMLAALERVRERIWADE